MSAIIIMCFLSELGFDFEGKNILSNVFPLFRGSMFFILYWWLLALNVFIWNSNSVNYLVVFGF
jgi:hypothetical protein